MEASMCVPPSIETEFVLSFWTFKFHDFSHDKTRKFHDLLVLNLAHTKGQLHLH